MPEGLKLQRVFIVVLIALFCCSYPVMARETKECPSLHTGPIAVFIGPTDEEIAVMKQKHGEDDFYVIADDAMYYDWQASEFLKKLSIPMCFTKKESHRFVTKADKGYSMDKPCEGWCLILWNGKDEPVFTDSIEVFEYEGYLKGAE